jgi:hypothetical protein
VEERIIVSDTDLKLAAQKQAIYLEAQITMGTISGTIGVLETKKEARQKPNLLILLVGLEGLEPSAN